MSLEIFESLEQGSEAWRQARCGVLTASVIGKLITPGGKVADNQTSRGLIREIVAERITGRPEDMPTTRDMERGTLDEPYARDIYAEHKDVEVEEVGFMVRDIDGHKLGYSPDGVIADDGLLEIKSRKPRLQIQYIMDGNIPHDHMAQMQAGMLVAGRDWCDYAAYSGGLHMPIRRVHKDSMWQQAIRDAVWGFEHAAADLIQEYDALVAHYPRTEYVDHYGDDIEITF